jgi:hypothetical protein
MELIEIYSIIKEGHETEFYQTMESLEKLVKKYCKGFELKITESKNVLLLITFNEKKELEKNFYNEEFCILKGSLRSICANVVIKINNIYSK